MKKKLMILGAGYFQKPVIEKAKEMGYHTVVLDRNPNAIGRPAADTFIKREISFPLGCLGEAKKHNIDGVILVGADLIESVSLIEEWKFGIPQKHRIRASNKYESKDILRRFGISVPKCSEVPMKMVLKPTRGWGSRDVTILDFEEEMVLEEFIEGDEITIDGIMVNGDVCVLGISDKLKPIPVVAQVIIYPSILDHGLIKDLTTQALHRLKVDNCAFHIEAIMDHYGKLYFIDIACRTTGGISTHIIPHISGTDFVGNIIKQAMGETPTDYKATCSKAAIFYFFFPPEGTVKSIVGFDKVKAMPFIADLSLDLKPGDIVKDPNIDSARVGHIIILGEDREEVEDHLNTINKTIKIEVE